MVKSKVNANNGIVEPQMLEITKVHVNRLNSSRITPYRKIPRTYSSLRVKTSLDDGTYIHFESKLEYEFFVLMSFDLNVDYMVEQPIKIEFLDFNKNPCSYTPDLLVFYRNDISPTNDLVPTLFEVKYSEEVKKNEDRVMLEMRVAEQVAREKGWGYELVTEHSIHGPRLINAKFFRMYNRIDVLENIEVKLLERLYILKTTTPKELINDLSKCLNTQALYLQHLWYLIRWRRVGVDFDVKINMNTAIWCMDNE